MPATPRELTVQAGPVDINNPTSRSLEDKVAANCIKYVGILGSALEDQIRLLPEKVRLPRHAYMLLPTPLFPATRGGPSIRWPRTFARALP